MQGFPLLILILLMAGTLGVLIAGLVVLGKGGGKAASKRSNKLMIARVVLQGLAILTLVGIVMMRALG
jgi:hypothetical protein